MRAYMAILIIAGAVLAGGACGPVNPPTGVVLVPGGRMKLTYRTELVSRAWGPAHEDLVDADGKVEVPAQAAALQTTRVAFEHELLLEVRDEGGSLAVAMTPLRIRVKGETVEPDSTVQVEDSVSWQ